MVERCIGNAEVKSSNLFSGTMRQEIRKFDMGKGKLETIVLKAEDREYKIPIQSGIRYISVSGMFDWELPITSYVFSAEDGEGFGEAKFDPTFYESLVTYCEEHFLKTEELLE